MIGVLRKMAVVFGEPVEYALRVGEEHVAMADRIGEPLSFTFQGEIFCIGCGRKTRKSFGQGYCYPCFQDSPECAPCIIRPELCRAHEGVGRDMEWERRHHLQEHVVYLTHTGSIKVGVTRSANLPARWIDQGATMAVALAVTPNRYEAGLIEVALKEHVSDRTNWRKMLQADSANEEDLLAEKRRLALLMPDPGAAAEDEVTRIVFPVERYPVKVKSVGFDKEPNIGGVLAGIKGQYLIFDDDRVLNVRRHQGYVVEVG